MTAKQSDIRLVVTTGNPEDTMALSKKSAPVSRVVGIDHISIRVSDYKKSKAFYGEIGRAHV